MSTVFLYCAAIGGTLLVVQFLLLAFGAGGDSDLPEGGNVGHDQGAFLKLFSLQTIITFATFFGLIGLATEKLAWSPVAVLVTASLAGISSLWIVAQLMRGLSRLQSSGTVDMKNAIGQTGNVYLRVPGAGDGNGRVLVQVQGRTIECRAISRSIEIPTGSTIRVVECVDGDLLVVEPVA